MNRQEGTGESGGRDCDRGGSGVNQRSGHPDERRGFRILGGRPHFPAESGALQGELQGAEEEDGDDKSEHPEVWQGKLGGQPPAAGGDRTGQ